MEIRIESVNKDELRRIVLEIDCGDVNRRRNVTWKYRENTTMRETVEAAEAETVVDGPITGDESVHEGQDWIFRENERQRVQE